MSYQMIKSMRDRVNTITKELEQLETPSTDGLTDEIRQKQINAYTTLVKTLTDESEKANAQSRLDSLTGHKDRKSTLNAQKTEIQALITKYETEPDYKSGKGGRKAGTKVTRKRKGKGGRKKSGTV